MITCDPYIIIEEIREGYIRYRQYKWPVLSTGIDQNEVIKRWEVIGTCTNIGNCYKGSPQPKPTLDCPVGTGFKGCCPLEIKEL